MYNTITSTATYTVVDIRKTFEGFDADLRMIAQRTEKLKVADAEKYIHDILAWAESKYIRHVDIALYDNNNNRAIKAVRYEVDENGKTITSDRAGKNDWLNIPNTRLVIFVSNNQRWNSLSSTDQNKFYTDKGFQITWGSTDLDTSYSNLSRENAQLYASNGYELQKINFK